MWNIFDKKCQKLFFRLIGNVETRKHILACVWLAAPSLTLGMLWGNVHVDFISYKCSCCDETELQSEQGADSSWLGQTTLYTWDRLNYFLPTHLDRRNMGSCSSYYFLICSEKSLGCYGWVVAVLSSEGNQGTGLLV